MQVLEFKKEINISPQIVWSALFDKENYNKWSSVFHAGSYYNGDLEPDAEVLLLTPEGHGMFSKITDYEPYKILTFMHLGEVQNGSKGEIIYENAFETYELEDLGKSTEVTVKLNCEDAYVAQMQKMFPNALEALKELAEKL